MDADGRAELAQRTGMMTFPQVIIGDELVGGFDRAVERRPLRAPRRARRRLAERRLEQRVGARADRGTGWQRTQT